MTKKAPAQPLHKYIFELLDKELRQVDEKEISKAVLQDDLEKDVYPITPGIMKLLKRFNLSEKFYFEHKGGKMTVHFTVNQDDNTLSVIVVR